MHSSKSNASLLLVLDSVVASLFEYIELTNSIRWEDPFKITDTEAIGIVLLAFGNNKKLHQGNEVKLHEFVVWFIIY